MARRLLSAATRVLAPNPTAEDLHFHRGPAGTPAPCFDARCASPRLDPSD